MPVLHTNFLNFEKSISITYTKKLKLNASRKALQKRILDYFKTKPKLPTPKFSTQGSYKMGTMVLGKDGEYDIDLGVYFLAKPNVTPATLKSNVFDAVDGHTEYGVENRDKCIRVIYSGDFDIDLPVYYKSSTDMHPFLATKQGWMKSDPKELCDWFEKKKDPNGQLKRLVKYFKYWANRKNRKMPSGIALTAWVSNNYKPNTYDDVAFYETAKAIKESFWWSISCTNPATPNDNLIEKLDANQKANFKKFLTELIQDAKDAIEEKDSARAIKIWKGQLSDRFK
jgi:hypothetical protein